MGKHKKPRSPRGFGRKGGGVRFNLEWRLKMWELLVNNKTQTRVTQTGRGTAILHRPGCKSATYHKPGSNK